MYWEGSAENFGSIANVVRSFATQVGFVVVEDTTDAGLSVTYTTSLATTTPFYPNSKEPLGAVLVYQLGSANIQDAWNSFRSGLAGTRKITLQDGTNERYFHLYFYDSKVVAPSGSGYSGIIEVWMSSGSSGVIKGSACTEIGIDTSSRVFLFGGTNDVGERYLYIVIETQPQYYSIVGFGTMDKNFDFAGGEFVVGNACPRPVSADQPSSQNKYSNRDYQGMPFGATAFIATTSDQAHIPSTVVRASLYTDVNPSTLPADQWVAGPQASGASATSSTLSPIFAIGGLCKKLFMGHGGIGITGWYGLFKCGDFPRNVFSGLNPLFPAWCAVRDVTTTSTPPFFAMIGSFPNVRFLDINSILVEDELQLGPDIWKTFPAKFKASSYTERLFGYTQNEGLAFLK